MKKLAPKIFLLSLLLFCTYSITYAGIFDEIDPLGSNNSLPCVITSVTKFIGDLGVALVVIFIIVGALKLMTSGGQPGEITKGRDMLMWSAIGLGVILLAQGLVYATIEVLGGSEETFSCEPPMTPIPTEPGGIDIQIPPAA